MDENVENKKDKNISSAENEVYPDTIGGLTNEPKEVKTVTTKKTSDATQVLEPEEENASSGNIENAFSPDATIQIMEPEVDENFSSDATIQIETGENTHEEKTEEICSEVTIFDWQSHDTQTFASTISEANCFEKNLQTSNKYRVENQMGEGGIGVVFNVVEQALHRRVAMKILQPQLRYDEKRLQDFINEAKIIGYLEHPNIMTIYELGLHEETGIFFTMKKIAGESLYDIVEKIENKDSGYTDKYNTLYLLSIFRKLCDAASYAHSKNILHLDIKPHNVMIGSYGETLLLDWGVAKVFGDIEQELDPVKKEFLQSMLDNSPFKNKGKAIVGTPCYMSSEQACGEHRRFNKTTDVFLLGATLYHLFTLKRPYNGTSTEEILYKATIGKRIAPQEIDPEKQIPERICQIINKAMSINQKDRYQTVAELSKDIDKILLGRWSKYQTKIFAKGQHLMQEGEKGEEAYLVLSGSVEVTKKGPKDQSIMLRKCRIGSILGEMSLISYSKRSATVTALEETKVAIITQEILTQELNKLPAYMERIVTTLTHRLNTLTDKVHPYLTSDCPKAIIKQFYLLFKVGQKNSISYDILEEIAGDLAIPKHKVEEAILKNAIELGFVSCDQQKIEVINESGLQKYVSK